MKVLGYHKKRKLNILIDTGSLSNFINERLTKGLCYDLIKTAPIVVILADGTKLYSQYKAVGFCWVMQGVEFKADFHLLPLSASVVILGVPWLRSLGTIQWNFVNMTMEFLWKNKNCHLQGEPEVFCHHTDQELFKCLNSTQSHLELQCWVICGSKVNETNKCATVLAPVIIYLLEEYDDIF